MLSLNKLIGELAAGFTLEERIALLGAIRDLALADGNFDLIEKIGLESTAGLLFTECGADQSALAGLEGVNPLEVFHDPQKQLVVMEMLCFTALSDSSIHPREVALIAEYARSWNFDIVRLRALSCFDPLTLLDQGLSESGDALLDELARLL
jgi:hypothetical protein